MSNFLTIRMAVNLSLIAALAIQPVAALSWGSTCEASDRAVCSSSQCGCCEARCCSCDGGGKAAADNRDKKSCCGHADAADRSSQLGGACSCGQFSQPLSESTSRPNSDSKRVEIQVASVMLVAAERGGRCGEAVRIGIAHPTLPEHFCQRNLCIWRI